MIPRLPLAVVLPAMGAGTVAATGAISLRAPLWSAVALGTAIAALGATRIHQTNIWRILHMRIDLWLRNRRGAVPVPPAEPFDIAVPDSAGAQCGMRWDGTHLITMLALDRTTVTPTLLATDGPSSGVTLSLADAADCLAQFDIRLAAIDVVTLGMRTKGPDDVVRLYERLLGPLPAAATQTVWLVLRFDPLDNVEAIDIRGSGQEGTVRTALVATRRVAARLASQRVRVTALTAAELTTAESVMFHDIAPREWVESWRTLRTNGFELAGFGLAPDRLNATTLGAVWRLPAKSVLTRVRLTPTAATAPGSRASSVAVSALVRRDLAGTGHHDDDGTPRALGLRALRGCQRQVLLDGGQLEAADLLRTTPQQLAEFTVAAAGSGQVIGATREGLGVAVPLFGPDIRRVEIVGSRRLAMLMVLRAVAVGAQVIVHSSRPADWAYLVDAVGTPTALAVSSPGSAQHTAAATMIVYDGVASTGQVSEATAVHVRAAIEAPSALLGADVVLIEDATDPTTVRVRTQGEELTVAVVSIAAEAAYLTPPETRAEAESERAESEPTLAAV
ncbi:type VII secretion protein EccE [Nocardia salmonicida]|uniref:type VII secretion protein EccE n=1 Tax=Nocardia salmonicida TaxID=53431 RepID=UPI0009FD5305|nr:type VII secretion protein EccE [Nocardia salmonicida]